MSEATAPVISFSGVTKRFGSVLAVDTMDLAIKPGEFLSFLGPSGCGKTTTLRMIAGFEQPDAGDIRIAGEPVVGVQAHLRPVNMVFQNYALFPHLSVCDNIAFGLRQQRPHPPAAIIEKAVADALALVRLEGFGSRRIWELSGGQQQRVALARALINRPKVLLLDEPLAALDRKLRRDMQIELQNLQQKLGITFILVTHDQEEALSMSDRVCIMRDGRIVQTGSPRELYDAPVSRYVADFVGKSNFLTGQISGRTDGTARITLDASGQALGGRVTSGGASLAAGSRAVLAVRPEIIALARTPSELGAVEKSFPVTVKNRIFLGEHTEYLVEAEGLGELLVLTPKRLEEAAGGFAPGEHLAAGWPREAALILADI